MQNRLVKKGIVVGIILLFLGTSIVSSNMSFGEDKSLPFLADQNEYFISTDWWDYNWSYRKQITINHSMVDADLQNFPVLITHTSSNFTDHAQPDGDDFVFIDSTNTVQYNYEIEYYNNTSGELIAWVNVTELSSSDDTILWLYYGNLDCGNQQSPEDVWDSNYKAVYHMNYESGGLNDSTSNDNNCDTVLGTPDYLQTGKVGYAIDFERSSGEAFEDGDIFDGLSEMTVEAWINLESYPSGSHCEIISHYGAWYLYVSYQSNKVIFELHGGSKQGLDIITCPIGSWYHVVGTFDDPQDDLQLFGNGELKDWDPESNNMPESSYNFSVGFRDNQGNYFDGLLDEIRVSNVERSIEWINTTYNSQNDTDSFMSFGDQEVYNNPPNMPSNPIPPDGSTVGIMVSLCWTGGDPNGNEVVYNVYFGNISPPPKILSNLSINCTDPGMLEFDTTYYWQIISVDEHGASTEGPIWEFTTRENQPPDAPIINGPHSVKRGRTYSYNFVAKDPNGDDVFYEIQWGDGEVTPWDRPHESNVIITIDHSWDEKGTFKIMARAKDEYGSIGEWGTFDITMPKNRFFNIWWFTWLLDRFQLLNRLLDIFGRFIK